MNTEGHALATAFLNANGKSEQLSYKVTGSTDENVITITRTKNEEVKKSLEKLSEHYDMSPYGSGGKCLVCGGTGRA